MSNIASRAAGRIRRIAILQTVEHSTFYSLKEHLVTWPLYSNCSREGSCRYKSPLSTLVEEALAMSITFTRLAITPTFRQPFHWATLRYCAKNPTRHTNHTHRRKRTKQAKICAHMQDVASLIDT
jgi:hypothetical protein